VLPHLPVETNSVDVNPFAAEPMSDENLRGCLRGNRGELDLFGSCFDISMAAAVAVIIYKSMVRVTVLWCRGRELGEHFVE